MIPTIFILVICFIWSEIDFYFKVKRLDNEFDIESKRIDRLEKQLKKEQKK